MRRLAPFGHHPLGTSRLGGTTDTSRLPCEQPHLPPSYLPRTCYLAVFSDSYSCLSNLTHIRPRLNLETHYPWNNCLPTLASPQSAAGYQLPTKLNLKATAPKRLL
ncbi:hypothetical protein COCCADRAFT_95049 [Bipolaris zeicola 26-R-13]|uniref:Uncharacterized protein n=1 Tax=Cochliobolus carbonum (strain 26-R-13) TaxID=930089 RepID=W6YED6_COCC2|nr:uncharacterized protein COCCADRAFT_95049 [Bipolaris zeicola 26-R-13]EUC33864.1 hypothetical protein COCCADRAFT_95049 [Bipolaris zeicola 26-R-13]